MPVIVAENDPIIRNIQVVLDPDTPSDRQDAIADYFSVDLPDFDAWREDLRARAPTVFPAEFRMADDTDAFRAALPDAAGAIVEGMAFGAAELDCAPNLKIVQKFGADLRNIDLEACAARGVPVRPLRRAGQRRGGRTRLRPDADAGQEDLRDRRADRHGEPGRDRLLARPL